MTPAVKPRAISKNFLFVDLKKKTKAAPRAVRIHVKSPAYKAIRIGLSCCLKKSKIEFKKFSNYNNYNENNVFKSPLFKYND
jgi:hypothetical protein